MIILACHLHNALWLAIEFLILCTKLRKKHSDTNLYLLIDRILAKKEICRAVIFPFSVMARKTKMTILIAAGWPLCLIST